MLTSLFCFCFSFFRLSFLLLPAIVVVGVCLTATSKGKYVALAVLLPRVGALRALELCPSLVEQLVWAVGVRGNVSGQAVSLLLQFLQAMSSEVSAQFDLFHFTLLLCAI